MPQMRSVGLTLRIGASADQKEMRELFHPGIISSLRFLTDDMGNRRGTAMVRLQSRAQAEEAIRSVSPLFPAALTLA